MDTREQRLEQALREIEGFVRRNLERAARASIEAQKRFDERVKGHVHIEDILEDKLEADARLHEAKRIHDVISFRVKEAL